MPCLLLLIGDLPFLNKNEGGVDCELRTEWGLGEELGREKGGETGQNAK